MIRFPSSRNSFLDAFGGPNAAKINQKSSSDDVKSENNENIDFLHPSLAKSLLLGSDGSQDRGLMRAISEFYTDQKR